MLDSFKKPPAEFRSTMPGQENKKPVLIRDLKREFDAMAISGSDLSDVSPIVLADSPHSRLFADYISRVSYTLSLGKKKTQVALLRPSEPDNLFDLYNSELPLAHVVHNIVDEDAICKATAVDQRLIISDDEYELLIMPPMKSIRYATAIKIQEFIEDGGRAMATGILPAKDSSGSKHEEISSIFTEIFGKSASDNGALFVDREPSELAKSLRKYICMAIKPVVSIRSGNQECRDITYTHRIWQEAEIFFFANGSDEPREVQLSIRCDKAPHILDPETGKRIALVNCTQIGSRTILLHRFESCGSLLMSFDDVPSLAIPTPYSEYGDEVMLRSDWDVVDGVDGVSFSQTVDIPEFLRIQRVVMSLEEPLDVVEFTVNGAVAGVRLWPPYEMDITALVKPGPNEITLKFNQASHFCGRGKITIY